MVYIQESETKRSKDMGEGVWSILKGVAMKECGRMGKVMEREDILQKMEQ